MFSSCHARTERSEDTNVSTHPIPQAARAAGDISSYLFVPGNRPDRFGKALAAGAGAIIVDLEDAVPAADKSAARDAVAAWLTPQQPALVRINAVNTPWFADDLAMCIDRGATAIVLPKAEECDEIALIADRSRDRIAIFPLIESARGIANVSALASEKNVRRLIFGSIDFRLDLGIDGDDADELLYFRSQLVLASRLAQLSAPVDGVTTDLQDEVRLTADTTRAKRLGFGGKCCIHPRQVDVVNRSFAPTADEIAWAHKVLSAAQAAGGAAISLDGEMLDRPVYARAEGILARQLAR